MGRWYLHLFAPEQPDFNWEHPAVRAEFEDILRFWLDRGVDGFRIDVAHGLVKKDGLPDVGTQPDLTDLPYQDVDGVHEVYRAWRRVLDTYAGERVFVGEVWLPTPDQFTRYLRPDELHSAFNFEFLCGAWDVDAVRTVIEDTLRSHDEVDAPPTWVLSNHDVVRAVTRYGRGVTAFDIGNRGIGAPSDIELGRRRARAAALLTLGLPGGVYLYQGDELGLAEVEDIPEAMLQDPVWERSGHADRGRDGCRVPLPWSGDAAPFGFGPAGSVPWLPQPAGWAAMTVAAQEADPNSMLALYRSALRLRHQALVGLPRRSSGYRAPPASWPCAGMTSSASSTSRRARSNCPRTPESSSRARRWMAGGWLPTPRCGSAEPSRAAFVHCGGISPVAACSAAA